MGFLVALAAMLSIEGFVWAQSELRFDPEKGTMIVDTKETETTIDPSAPRVSSGKNDGNRRQNRTAPAAAARPYRSAAGGHLSVGEKNDRSSLYFMSGLDYFKNADYPNALREFRYADSLSSKPLYLLLIGTTLRRLGQGEEMLAVLRDLIKKNPRCDVADDALYELAAYYQNIDDYATASRYYAKIVDQYPSGESYSTAEKISGLARDQRAFMRAEMSNKLAFLGYTHDNPDENLRAFQRNHRLEQTGDGNSKTVSEIKKAYTTMLNRDRLNEEDTQRARRYLFWAGIAAAIGFVNMAFSAAFFFNLRGKQRLLSRFRETISGLDTRNI